MHVVFEMCRVAPLLRHLRSSTYYVMGFAAEAGSATLFVSFLREREVWGLKVGAWIDLQPEARFIK